MDTLPSVSAVAATPTDAAEAVVAVADRPRDAANGANLGAASQSESPDMPFDETAEAVFLGEARERGEIVVAGKPADSVEEIADPKTLPSLDELVKRIPSDVRETLEDLFRARFVAVRRLPAKALKSS